VLVVLRTFCGTLAAVQPLLSAHFYATDNGNEPARDWLRGLPREQRQVIGEDIKTVQFGWPMGMPLVRKLAPALWEVRSVIPGGIARVLFTVSGTSMVLLHGFLKKSQAMPGVELDTAIARLLDLRRRLR